MSYNEVARLRSCDLEVTYLIMNTSCRKVVNRHLFVSLGLTFHTGHNPSKLCTRPGYEGSSRPKSLRGVVLDLDSEVHPISFRGLVNCLL
jgi:hypothetical protein